MPEFIAPPSAPMLTVTPPEASPVPLLNDDIADPPVPESVLTPPPPETAHNAPQARQVRGAGEDPALAPLPAVDPAEALQHGFLAAVIGKLQEEQTRILDEIRTAQHDLRDDASSFNQAMASTWQILEGLVKKAGEANEHATYQLANALTAVQEKGLQVRNAPYSVTVQVMSPQGYPLTLTISKESNGDLVQELQMMLPWLAQSGYKPVG